MRFASLLPMAMLLLSGCISDSGQPSDNMTDGSDGTSAIDDSLIKSFEDCVAAGYPVMESYPRQCRTSDGRTFISLQDLFDSSKDTSCSSDGDCMLVDEELAFSCCYAGACREMDYSEDKWIAVNKDWYEGQRAKRCPEDCGPAPLCPVRVKDDNFTATCLYGICAKVPIQAANLTAEDASNMTEEGNQTVEQHAEEPVDEPPEGTLFGQGRYLLVLEDVVLPRYDATCGAFSIIYAGNASELTKLLICEGDSQHWTSPEGQQYRIRVLTVAAGFTANARWADVRIYG